MYALGISLLLVGLIGLFIYDSLRKFPTDPPTYGIRTFFGKRTKKVLKEGWHFLPFCPFVFGAVLVDMTAKNQDFKPEDVRTPDMAELEIDASLTFRPDPGNLISYLNIGGEEGVRNIMDDVVPEAIRELAANPDEEPKTWEMAVKMKGKFLARVITVITGTDGQMTDEEIQALAIDVRRENGSIKIETLGIIVSRLNITSIKPQGELAKAAEQAAKERRERDADKIEIANVAARVKALTKTGLSAEMAAEMVQTERGKVKKTINETKHTVSGETLKALETLGPVLKSITELFKKGGSTGGNS